MKTISSQTRGYVSSWSCLAMSGQLNFVIILQGLSRLMFRRLWSDRHCWCRDVSADGGSDLMSFVLYICTM